ncbi:hypothetical protein C2S53_004662 [Perilla frutescens var. hirtella]|uniref:Late embryogenesis abundant protein LEA-2 subgroup domain-containing protein n=1 Tax=Perilla frutescens var. hirtella TaxID=608512 RepID=A0AAD4JI58_PERFH|nr:hypothetical protein C2S53_004662 [Perilla frutescens var. hirtella]
MVPHAAADTPSPPSSTATSQTDTGQNPKRQQPPPPKNPVPPPPAATYVVRIPREQILRQPPPENAKKYEELRLRRNRRSCCCRCCCATFCLLFLLIVAAAIAAGVMYLVFQFKSPMYTVTRISVKGMNLTSAAPISPRFNVSVRAENPNGKVGIYYSKDSAVSVFYNGVSLGDGVLPDFYQPRTNVTVLRTTLTASDVVLDGAVKTALRGAQSKGRVPLVVNVEAPVKFKVGSVKTWELTAKVKCDVVLDVLNEKANIVSKDCDYSVRLW